MSRSEIIRQAIAEVTGKPLDGVTNPTRLSEDLGLRSLQRVELAVILEDRLKVKVPDRTVMNARTVGDLEAAIGAEA